MTDYSVANGSGMIGAHHCCPNRSCWGRNTVEPLKTDTPRDIAKNPSYKGVRPVKVFQNFHIAVRVTLQIPVKYQFVPLKMNRLAVFGSLSAFTR